MKRAVIVCVGLIALLAPVTAQAEPIGYTVSGFGGLSEALPGLSDDPFWWINATGGAGLPESYGLGTYSSGVGSGVFDFVERSLSGSLLLSSEFTLTNDDILTVGFSLFSASDDPWFEIGFAVLLQDGAIEALLGAMRPDGRRFFGDLHPAAEFPLPSPGVVTTSTRYDLGEFEPFTLGGIEYGASPPPLACFRDCKTEVTSTLAPGTGTYQLLFGAFGGGYGGALAVTSVDVQAVPEPSTLLLIGGGLAGLIAKRARRRHA